MIENGRVFFGWRKFYFIGNVSLVLYENFMFINSYRLNIVYNVFFILLKGG